MTKRLIALAVLLLLAIPLVVRLYSKYEEHVEKLALEKEEASRAEWIARLVRQPHTADSLARLEEASRSKADRKRREDEMVDYQAACLAEHLSQIQDGTLEGIRTGRLCWYCKKPHAWKDCVSR